MQRCSNKGEYLVFDGEIVFEIADVENIEVNSEMEIEPTKVVRKGSVVALGRKAPKNRWIYGIKYDGEKEYLKSLEMMVNQLCDKKEYINQLVKQYEEVSISIFVRSDFAGIDYSFPNYIMKKLSLLDCAVNFEVFSFGMAVCEEK